MSGVFEGVGTLQFTPDAKYASIYSGEKSMVSGTSQDVLIFTTGSYYLIAKYCWFCDSSTTPDEIFTIKFNDITIINARYANAVDASSEQPIPLIIPPFTTVKVNYEVQGTATATFHLVADVKGAIEQIDLEAIRDGSKWADQ